VFDPGAATKLPPPLVPAHRRHHLHRGAAHRTCPRPSHPPLRGNQRRLLVQTRRKTPWALPLRRRASRLIPSPTASRDRPCPWNNSPRGSPPWSARTEATINELIRAGLDDKQPPKSPSSPATIHHVHRHRPRRPQIRSSVYATAALAVDPWLEPAVAHSASDSPRPFYWSNEHYQHRPRTVDLEWLIADTADRTNTLYLTASQPEFERLSPVLGGLLADLKDSIHARDIAGR
jgi:hypothetical protein